MIGAYSRRFLRNRLGFVGRKSELSCTKEIFPCFSWNSVVENGHTFCTSSNCKVCLGDKVSVRLHLKIKDGETFHSNLEKDDDPLEVIVGRNRFLIGVEQALLGMSVGSKKTLDIPPELAFGHRSEELVITIPKKDAPPNLKVGDTVDVNDNGRVAIVQKVDDKDVVLDFNHFLCGATISAELNIEEHTPKDQLPKEVEPSDEITPGDGTNFPVLGSRLKMHYTGKLASNEQIFDCSRKRGQPFEFTIGIGQVIQGWDEGVMKMSLGQRCLLKIPANKGYGARGAGDAIPPNADLIFDVELLEIN